MEPVLEPVPLDIRPLTADRPISWGEPVLEHVPQGIFRTHVAGAKRAIVNVVASQSIMRRWLKRLWRWLCGEHVPEPVPPAIEHVQEPVRRPNPPAKAQAEVLLQLLLELFPLGSTFFVASNYVEGDRYPKLVRERGWRAHAWGGRKGVGEHFGKLPGVRRCLHYWPIDGDDTNKERLRSYEITSAATNVVELPKRA